MAKLIISIDGVVVSQLQLTQDRSTIGRRPHNAVVLDDVTVSGEHAVITLSADGASIQDLKSTNGTFVNGEKIERQRLVDSDLMEIGRYQIVYQEQNRDLADALSGFDLDGVDTGSRLGGARLRVLSGSAKGREILLMKPVTTFGKRSVAIAAITRVENGYSLSHVSGKHVAAVNGVSVADGPILLANRDQISMGGALLEYLDA